MCTASLRAILHGEILLGTFLIGTLLFSADAKAQGPAPHGGGRQAINAIQGINANQGMAGNMPSVAELAQRMMASYDANGSGELDQAELQNALSGLRQMMMQNQQGLVGRNVASNQNAQAIQNGVLNNQRGLNARQQKSPFAPRK
jgi:hypothetical protein